MTQYEQHSNPGVGSALRLAEPSGGRPRERLVIVGGGMASLRLIEEVVSLCPGRYEAMLIGREPHPPYNRVLLSSLLAGEAEEADIELRPRGWYADNGVKLVCGDAALELRPVEREVVLASGARLAYDRLVLATGSNAIRLPIPGHDLRGVTTFRDLADAEALRVAAPGTRAVVYAIGECAEHRGLCYGLVEPAYAQAKMLARYLAGLPARYQGRIIFERKITSRLRIWYPLLLKNRLPTRTLSDDADADVHASLPIKSDTSLSVTPLRRKSEPV